MLQPIAWSVNQKLHYHKKQGTIDNPYELSGSCVYMKNLSGMEDSMENQYNMVRQIRFRSNILYILI